MNIAPQQIAERVGTLPTLPVAVTRLMSLINDDRATASDFERVVKVDVALTANLLRVSNSVLFRGTTKVTSVAQAIVRLGLRRVSEVATSDAFRKLVPAVLPGYQMASSAFWLHSIAVATLSDRIAREAKVPNAGAAFTAGLLHDIGKLVIGEFLAQEQGQVTSMMEGERLAFVAAEQASLGTDHAEVGLLVARKWNLPAEVSAAARWHHQPERSTEPLLLVDVVHVANSLAHTFGLGTDIGGLHRRLSKESLTRLKLDRTDLERLVSLCITDVMTSAAVLGGETQP